MRRQAKAIREHDEAMAEAASVARRSLAATGAGDRDLATACATHSNVLAEVASVRLFAAMVRAVREARGMTQTQLAEAAGVASGKGEIARIESGAHPVGEAKMAQIASGFGLTLRAFLVEAESVLRAREGQS